MAALDYLSPTDSQRILTDMRLPGAALEIKSVTTSNAVFSTALQPGKLYGVIATGADIFITLNGNPVSITPGTGSDLGILVAEKERFVFLADTAQVELNGITSSGTATVVLYLASPQRV